MKGFGLLFWLGYLSVASITKGAIAAAPDRTVQQQAACSAKSNKLVTSVKDAEQVVVCAARPRGLLIVGEIHGSNETPALVFALVKRALSNRPVRLGLEIPVTEQASIETYLHSSGNPADQVKLLAGPFWNQMRDGRSSKAMLQLIDGMRALKAAGANVDIFTMEPDYGREMDAVKRDGVMSVKESGMARAIRSAMVQDASPPFAIALMGNFHARDGKVDLFKGSPPGSVTEQLAASMPYVLLPFSRDGSIWNCTEQGCGVHPAKSRSAPKGKLPVLVNNFSEPSGPTVVTLWLPSLSASLPANAQTSQPVHLPSGQ